MTTHLAAYPKQAWDSEAMLVGVERSWITREDSSARKLAVLLLPRRIVVAGWAVSVVDFLGRRRKDADGPVHPRTPLKIR